MQEATQERTVYPGSGRGAVRPARGCARALYYLAPGVPIVGEYRRGERRREAPRSLLEEELVEVSANIECSVVQSVAFYRVSLIA